MTPLVLRPAATDVDWTVIRGDTFDLHVPVLDSTGAPVTVTGWTAKAQVRHTPTDPLLHEWSAAQANLTLAGTEVVLAFSGPVTAAWAWTDAQVSVVVTDLTGKTHVIAQGVIHALPQITT